MSDLDKEIESFAKEKPVKKIFAEVLDLDTVKTIHSLAQKKYVNVVEFVVSTGKEAHVFRARDKAGNYRAVKIYKVETSRFKQMAKYVEGDIRFKNISRNKRSLIYAWTKKEYRNLEKINETGARAPIPIAFKNNVLVMEFIGKKGEAALPIKENPIKDLGLLYERVVDYVARMLFLGKLVHADLSEYNILNFNEEPVLIDCGQAVLNSHPKARDFFERDIRNMSNYFQKMGFETEFKQMYEDVKAKKRLYLG